jgi:hypothetical protein
MLEIGEQASAVYQKVKRQHDIIRVNLNNSEIASRAINNSNKGKLR